MRERFRCGEALLGVKKLILGAKKLVLGAKKLILGANLADWRFG